jgi:methylphosphotriester-DNA--protein-cysteine methyltransferase
MTARTYTLLGSGGQPYQSATPGALSGHRRARVYGRLDCRAALRAIARGQYVRNRVFFADEQTAVAAGYRPCAVCLPDEFTRSGRQRGLSKVAAGALVRLPSMHSRDVCLEGEASRFRRL